MGGGELETQALHRPSSCAQLPCCGALKQREAGGHARLLLVPSLYSLAAPAQAARDEAQLDQMLLGLMVFGVQGVREGRKGRSGQRVRRCPGEQQSRAWHEQAGPPQRNAASSPRSLQHSLRTVLALNGSPICPAMLSSQQGCPASSSNRPRSFSSCGEGRWRWRTRRQTEQQGRQQTSPHTSPPAACRAAAGTAQSNPPGAR